jgi:hypothetical protein
MRVESKTAAKNGGWIHRGEAPVRFTPRPPSPSPATKTKYPPRNLRVPTHAELATIATRRTLCDEGLQLAVDRGMLWVGEVWDNGLFPSCWIITDRTHRNMQARRLDGQPFVIQDAPKKAKTCKGFESGWPIGLREAGEPDVQAVLVVEGGPDLLAAHHFAWCEKRERNTAVVCLTGCKNRLDLPDSAGLAGKRVRIVPHVDLEDQGQAAALSWARQLSAIGATVDILNLDGLLRCDTERVKDLNDLALIDADHFEENRELWGVWP